MIEDLALRWVITLLFAVSATERAVAAAAARHRPTAAVGALLHVVMAIAMAVMAWPRGALLPTDAPMVFFLLAALWFVAMLPGPATTMRSRLVNAYHAAMMLAMAWMYLIMSDHLGSGHSDTHDPAGGHPPGHVPGAAGHSAGHDPAATGHSTGHDPGAAAHGAHGPAAHQGDGSAWLLAANWVVTLAFAAAAGYWLYRYITWRPSQPGSQPRRPFSVLCEALTAAGMAAMFAVTL